MSLPANGQPTLPWGDGPYSIQRHGTTLASCDSEPVQTPGCIQAHGALLVLRLSDLRILQASDNTGQHLGQAAASLLGLPVSQVIGEAHAARLREMLARESLGSGAAYAFTLPARAGAVALDVCVHISGGGGDTGKGDTGKGNHGSGSDGAVVVLEFEGTGRADPLADNDFFMLVKAAVGRLQAPGGVRSFCQQVTQEVRAITGLDRVMAYRFHADHHGEVIAESKRDALEPWLGLHYPAADIPQPARDIFKRLWIRPLPDAAGPLVELLPLANPDTGLALDMTHCALRGASVMYTEYLANMGVAASLTMPLMRDGELWGLIACHHHSPATFRYEVRAACELLAQVASLTLKSAQQAEELAYRLKLEDVHQRLVVRSAREGDLLALTAHDPSLLDAIDAGGAALYHLNRWWCIGNVPDLVQLDRLAAWLYDRPEFAPEHAAHARPVFATEALASVCPVAVGLEDVAAGLLATVFSRQRRGLLVWFRPQTLRTVTWAGDPHGGTDVVGPHGPRLTPRVSFAIYTESVRGHATAWSDIEIDAVLRLRMLVLELVINQGERLADLNAVLTRSNEELDAFAYVASHDLKEPLGGIHRYAHQLLESAQAARGGARDGDGKGTGGPEVQREDLRRVDSLMRLTLRMDSLLDSLLHFSQVGRMELEFGAVDLNAVVADAIEMAGMRRRDSPSRIDVPRPMPIAQCDPVRVCEIFSNLLSNALKYRRQESAEIELGYIGADEAAERPNAPAVTAGQDIFYVRDQGIGIDSRHFEQVFRLFKRMHGREDYGGGVGAGLTIVQKLVHRHGGRIWIDSRLGEGCTFYFTLPGNRPGLQSGTPAGAGRCA